MTVTIPREPTSDECNINAEVDGGRACWYPSMGGYAAKCVAIERDGTDDTIGCWDLYVWHNGSFPFSGDCQRCGDDRSPVELHHCDPTDFIRFGKLIERFGETS